ncbi:MAG: c-type cytochrome [Rhodoferax sp.]|uniref:c-type cytochrome n=1 Tax=Rhodoferax sp. TaxID=50421 RepID=UPI00301A1DE9
MFIGTMSGAWSQAPSIFQEADIKLGERLLAENNCATCHQKNVGGDGSAIYRPAGRINSPSALVSMVETCNTQLNLTLFPDEVTSMAAVLNRDYYRFK